MHDDHPFRWQNDSIAHIRPTDGSRLDERFTEEGFNAC